MDRALRPLERSGVPEELMPHVGGRAERVELERELCGIDPRVELSGVLGRADQPLDERGPVIELAGDRSRTEPGGRLSYSTRAASKKQPPRKTSPRR